MISVPSKHARSHSHPVRIGLEALARSRPNDSCTPACFWTGSIWPKHETISQNYIGSGLVLHNIIWNVCGRMQPSLRMENWQRAGCILPETGPDDSSTPACFQTRCVWPNPDQATLIRSGLVLNSMSRASFGKTELKRIREVGSNIYYPAQFWLHAGHNGHNCP